MRKSIMTSLLISVVVAGVLACDAAQSTIATSPSRERFHSDALNRTMRYQIVVPGAATTSSPVPVVYLLHGHGGGEGDWFTYSRAAALANQHNVAVVTPDGANSWYINGGSGRWHDYIADDLIREVEKRWPVRTTREGRAIAGLSMGGYGAMNLALQRPAMFALAASMSGALDISRATNVFERRRVDEEVRAAFGPPDSATRRDNDIYRLASEADASKVPYLHIDCGVDDPWMGVNREFTQVLTSRGITHDFQELPGNHNWRYWDRQIEVVLALAAKRLK